MDKNTQNIDTPKYDKTSGLLTDYGRSLGLKEVNQSISSDGLSTKQPINLPKETNSTIPEFNLPKATPLEQETAKIKAQQEKEVGGISSLLQEIGLTQGKEATFATQAGADKAQEEYDRYSSELEAEQLANRRAIENLRNKNQQGVFGGGLEQEIERLNRESVSKQADLAILGNAARGRFDTAMSIAKRKVESALVPLQAQLDAKKFVYENNKELFSTAQLSKLNGLIKADERKIAEETNNKLKSEEMIINAIQGRAPQALITKARDVLSKGGKLQDVATILGDYSLSEGDRLDLRIKRAQASKIENENIGLSKEEVKQKQQLLTQVPIIKEKLNLIDSILKNPAITTSVGASRQARKGYFAGIPYVVGVGSSPDAILNTLTGKKQNLIAGVNQLVSKEFLQSILNLKAQGGTLGQLTEREGEKLQQAATKIGTWEIRNKKGEVTGYNVSEKDFINELNQLKSSIKSIYEASGGDTSSFMTEEEYINEINKQLQVNPYLQAGYEV